MILYHNGYGSLKHLDRIFQRPCQKPRRTRPCLYKHFQTWQLYNPIFPRSCSEKNWALHSFVFNQRGFQSWDLKWGEDGIKATDAQIKQANRGTEKERRSPQTEIINSKTWSETEWDWPTSSLGNKIAQLFSCWKYLVEFEFKAKIAYADLVKSDIHKNDKEGVLNRSWSTWIQVHDIKLIWAFAAVLILNAKRAFHIPWKSCD